MSISRTSKADLENLAVFYPVLEGFDVFPVTIELLHQSIYFLMIDVITLICNAVFIFLIAIIGV
jgi:hypothetical protein